MIVIGRLARQVFPFIFVRIIVFLCEQVKSG